METGGNTTHNELWLTTQLLTLVNPISDSFSKSGLASITVTLESEESSHEQQVKLRLQRMGDVIQITTLVLTPAQKSSFAHISSVTSQKLSYGPKIPLQTWLTKYASPQS